MRTLFQRGQVVTIESSLPAIERLPADAKVPTGSPHVPPIKGIEQHPLKPGLCAPAQPLPEARQLASLGKLIPSRCSHPDTLPSVTNHSERAQLDVQCGPLGNSKWKSLLEIQHYPISETACRQTETSTVGPSVFGQILRRKHVPTHFANDSDRGPAVRRYQFRRNAQPCHHSVRFVR